MAELGVQDPVADVARRLRRRAAAVGGGEASAGAGLEVRLLDLVPARSRSGAAGGPGGAGAVQVELRFLVAAAPAATEADGGAAEGGQGALVDMLFGLLDDPWLEADPAGDDSRPFDRGVPVEVEATPPPVELWQAWGAKPKPCFVVRATVRRELRRPVTRRVSEPLEVRLAPIPGGSARLTGRVLGPHDRPVADAAVVVAATGATARTGADGTFEFRCVPAGDRAPPLRVEAKGRQFEFPSPAIDGPGSAGAGGGAARGASGRCCCGFGTCDTAWPTGRPPSSAGASGRFAMPATYRAPDVYVEEISTGPRPIEAVGTSTAGFLGKAPHPDAPKHAAEAVENWAQFIRRFVADPAGRPDRETPLSTPLAQAVWGFFQNGGSRCYVCNVGEDGIGGGGAGGRRGVDVFEEVDEIAIVAAPGYTDAQDYDALIGHCLKLKDRVAILDAAERVRSTSQLTKLLTADVPKPKTPAAGGAAAPESPEPPGASRGLRPPDVDGGFAAFYHPWLVVRDALDPKAPLTVTPPSGYMAGVWARTDATRGVHKAPANEPVIGALNLTSRVTRSEQDELNQRGVNCIRLFDREGIRAWGARTLDGSGEWKYLNVRRLFNMIEESIARSTRWVVFEPNDATLWKSIARDVGAFLTILWRGGALMGRTPAEAFFVKCDAETNPPEVIDAGQVVAMVGIAPVKPAEFVVFRIGQGAAVGGAAGEGAAGKQAASV